MSDSIRNKQIIDDYIITLKENESVLNDLYAKSSEASDKRSAISTKIILGKATGSDPSEISLLEAQQLEAIEVESNLYREISILEKSSEFAKSQIEQYAKIQSSNILPETGDEALDAANEAELAAIREAEGRAVFSKPKPEFVIAWTEPQSAANSKYQPIYPYNNVQQTKGGHSFEMDDTPTRERIRLQHGKGNFIEMHPNNDQVTKILGDGYEIVLKDKNMEVRGKLNITVVGDANFWIQGDKIEQVEGNVEQFIKGNYTQVVQGLSSVYSAGDMTISSGSSAFGSLTLKSSDAVNIQGDISIQGEATATKITSLTRVDAGTGVGAGPLGFVTALGGVSVGMAGVPALPATIMSSGPIVSLSKMAAPLGTFGISGSVLAFDIVNMMLRKVHTHPAPKGVTGPPISKEMSA